MQIITTYSLNLRILVIIPSGTPIAVGLMTACHAASDIFLAKWKIKIITDRSFMASYVIIFD